MGFFDSILYGFQVTFQPINFLFCGIGVLLGTLVGVLPGIGPAGAMALLLPATFKFSSTSTLILLARIYYGVQYEGSTTSILVNIPGEASSVITCLDGHQMARQGRAGPALGIAAWGSFIAGTIANIGLMFVAVPFAHAALSLGPPEYFSLMCMGLIIVTYLAQRSILKAIMMALVGIIIGSIGLDLITGLPRFTLGINELTDGVGIVPLVMGLFGISEILENLEGNLEREVFKTHLKNLWPSLKDWAQVKWAIVRGSVIGFVLGILPGGGAVISTFVAYAVERKVSKNPEKFGKGAIEGVASPESANNAAAGASLIPLLSLGIPPNPIMALPTKAKVFIQAYVCEAKFNATQAAKVAGYKSPGVQGSQLKAKYAKEIEELVLGSQTSETMSSRESLKILAKIARDPSHKDRLRAIEISLKAHGLLSDKLNLNIKREDLQQQLIEIAQNLLPAATVDNSITTN